MRHGAEVQRLSDSFAESQLFLRIPRSAPHVHEQPIALMPRRNPFIDDEAAGSDDVGSCPSHVSQRVALVSRQGGG